MQIIRKLCTYLRTSKSSQAEIETLLKCSKGRESAWYANELGKLKHHQGDLLEARRLYDLSLSYFERATEDKQVRFHRSIVLASIAAVEAEMGNYEIALHYAEECYFERQLILNRHVSLAEAAMNVGSILFYMKRFTRATECFEEALEGFLLHYQGKEDVDYVVLAFYNLGTCYVETPSSFEAGKLSIAKAVRLGNILWGGSHPLILAMREYLSALE